MQQETPEDKTARLLGRRDVREVLDVLGQIRNRRNQQEIDDKETWELIHKAIRDRGWTSGELLDSQEFWHYLRV